MLKTIIFTLEYTLSFQKMSESKRESLSIPMFDLSNRKSSYQIRQGLVHLWNLVALKALGLKKFIKKIEFEGV